MPRSDESQDRPVTRVFISYSRRDRALVSRIVAALEAAADIEVFRDTDDILPTEEWKHRLEELIGEADTVVFALSPHSAKSDVCAWEVGHAMRLNKRIAPIVIRDVAPADVPATLSRYNYIFFTKRGEFDASIANLVAALNTDIVWIREHTRLGEAARRWARTGSRTVRLLRGDDLTQAESWIARQPDNAPPPSTDHHAFVAASRRAATRRQRAWFGGSLFAALAMALVAAFALQQRNAAIDNELRAEENAAVAMANEQAATTERDRAERERNRAVEAEALAEQRAEGERIAREQAEHALRAATETAGTMITQLAVEFRSSGVPVATVNGILEAAKDLLASLAAQGASNAELLGTTAEAYNEIADTLMALGNAEASRQAAQRAIDIARRLNREDPDLVRWRRALSRGLGRLGETLIHTGNFEAGQAAISEAVAITRAVLRADPRHDKSHADLVNLLQRSAVAAFALDLGDEALDWLREAEAAARRAVSVQPQDVTFRAGLASTLNLIGTIGASLGTPVDALGPFEEALTVFSALSTDDPLDTVWRRHMASVLESLGRLHLATGDFDGAAARFSEAIDVVSTLVRADPDNVEMRANLAAAQVGAARAQQSLGDLTAALELAAASVDGLSRIAEADPENAVFQGTLAEGHFVLATVYVELGQAGRALEHYRAQVGLLRQVSVGPAASSRRDLDLAVAVETLGDVEARTGDAAAAEAQFATALRQHLRLAAADPESAERQRDISVLHRKLADMRELQGDRADALEHYRAALAIADRLVARDRRNAMWLDDQAYFGASVALTLSRMNDLDAAAAAYVQAARAAAALVALDPQGERSLQLAAAIQVSLAETHMGRDDTAAAIAAYGAARDLYETLAAGDPSNVERQQELLHQVERLADLHGARNDIAMMVEALVDMDALGTRLVALEPRRDERRLYVVKVRLKLAGAQMETGDAQAALATYGRLAALGDDPGWARALDHVVLEGIAQANHEMGRILGEAGDMDAAAGRQRLALSMRAELLFERPDDLPRTLALAESIVGVTWVHYARRENFDALAACRSGAALLRPLVEAGSLPLEWQLWFVWMVGMTGKIQLDEGNAAAAVEAFGESILLQQGLIEAYPDNTPMRTALARDLATVASAHVAMGDTGPAVTAYRAGVEVLTRLVTDDPGDLRSAALLAQMLMDLGDLLADTGQAEDGLDVYRMSRAVHEAILQAYPDDRGWHHRLALVYWRLASHGEEPRSNWQGVIDIFSALLDEGYLAADAEPWLDAARRNLADAIAAEEGR